MGSYWPARCGMPNLVEDLLAEETVADMKKIYEGKWIKRVGSCIKDPKGNVETVKDTYRCLKCSE